MCVYRTHRERQGSPICLYILLCVCNTKLYAQAICLSTTECVGTRTCISVPAEIAFIIKKKKKANICIANMKTNVCGLSHERFVNLYSKSI